MTTLFAPCTLATLPYNLDRSSTPACWHETMSSCGPRLPTLLVDSPAYSPREEVAAMFPHDSHPLGHRWLERSQITDWPIIYAAPDGWLMLKDELLSKRFLSSSHKSASGGTVSLILQTCLTADWIVNVWRAGLSPPWSYVSFPLPGPAQGLSQQDNEETHGWVYIKS